MFHITRHFRKALQPLANSVLDLAAPERHTWLQALRADCPTVARELERVLGEPLTTAHRDADGPGCGAESGSPEYLGLHY